MATPVNNPSTDDLTEAQKQEYNRWQGYANALLVASTVLFAGTAIAFPKTAEFAPILSAIFGLVAIVAKFSGTHLSGIRRLKRANLFYC